VPGPPSLEPLRRRAGAIVAGAVVVLLAVGLLALRDDDEQAVRPTVYAAASLREALPRVLDARFSFAGSDALQRQIERGAPADLFVAASPRATTALSRGGRCERPVAFASNALVLLVPSTGARLRALADLRRLPDLRIAIGAPGVPVGDHARELVRRLGLRQALRAATESRETSVAGVVARVALGSADAGFAYRTDAPIAGPRVRAIALPARAQPPIRYEACVVRRPGAATASARELLRRLTGPRAQELLRRSGFGPAP
jgi:molybdate transport system substrate-binding protein